MHCSQRALRGGQASQTAPSPEMTLALSSKRRKSLCCKVWDISLKSKSEHFLMRVPGLVFSCAVLPDIFLLSFLCGFIPWPLWPCLLTSDCSPAILPFKQLQLSFEPSSVRAQVSSLPAHCYVDSSSTVFLLLPARPSLSVPFSKVVPALNQTERCHVTVLPPFSSSPEVLLARH